MMTLDFTCGSCKNFLGRLESGGYYCKAFPKGIPREVLFSKGLHTRVKKDQVGDFVFEPIDGSWAEFIYGKKRVKKK